MHTGQLYLYFTEYVIKYATFKNGSDEQCEFFLVVLFMSNTTFFGVVSILSEV
jgi:hypothetical protein